jgi:hypothetical protein
MKTRVFCTLSLCLAAQTVACLLAAAPANGVGGPISGFVPDGRSHTLRPINGFPGSATLGTPVSLPFSAGVAAISTGLDYAIVTDAHGTGDPYLARGLASGTPTVTRLAGGIAATHALVAGSGTAAVLYSQGGARLQFVSGLPAQPQPGDPVDLSALNGGVAALAVDSTGRTVLLIAADGGIYQVGTDGQGPRFIVRAAGASAVSLLPNGQDALIASQSTGDILLIRGFAGAATVSTLTGAGAGIASATAVQALSDHQAAVVDGAGRLALVDLDTAAVTWMGLAGKADRIELLANNLFLLNHPGSGPLLLLDPANGGSAFFVPAEAANDFEQHKGKDLWKH